MEIYKLEDLEKKTGISIKQLREFIKHGEIIASKIGRAYVIQEPDFIDFLNRYKNNKVSAYNRKDKK